MAEVKDIEKFLGSLGFGLAEELLGGIFLEDTTLVHEDDPIGNGAGELHFVGHNQHGPAFLSQVINEL